MRLRALVVLLTALASLGVSAPSMAITDGTPDGEGHPNVAAIIAYTPEGRALCSATLIAPRVLLTAGHCAEGVIGRVLVDFDSVITNQPPLPFSADPSVGFSTGDIAAYHQLAGTATPYPGFDNFSDAKFPNDVGVVVLDTPATGPATVASVGTLDSIAQSALSTAEFTIVGYGAQVRKVGTGPAEPQYYPLMRRTGTLNGHKVTGQILETNPGGFTTEACFGDSGGPVFYNGAVVAVTSTGGSSSGKCTGVAQFQRVDLPAVQQWLASVVQSVT